MGNCLCAGILVCLYMALPLLPVYAQPQVQVIPETIDFGEVEPYSPKVKVQKVTISNCGDGILCWGIEADDDWLSVEGTSTGVIDLPAGDQKYVQVSLSACGLCIVPQLQSEGKDPVGIHAGTFLVKQYAYDLELLVNAKRLGYRVGEMPIVLNYRFQSRIKTRAVWNILLDTLAIFYRMKILHYYDRGSVA